MLETNGFDPIIDRQDIDAGEEWKKRLGNLIFSCDKVIFVLSKTSISSDNVQWEVEQADWLGKSMIPIVSESLEGGIPPAQLSKLNYIYFYFEPEKPGSGFYYGIENLDSALRTDLKWVRQRTQLMEQAQNWRKRGALNDCSSLLRGNLLQEALEWSGNRPDHLETTDEIVRFINASEKLEALRQAEAESDLKEKQEAVAAAELATEQKEAALLEAQLALDGKIEVEREAAAREGKRRKQVVTLAATIVTVLALGSAGAGYAANLAMKQSEIAILSKEKAEKLSEYALLQMQIHSCAYEGVEEYRQLSSVASKLAREINLEDQISEDLLLLINKKKRIDDQLNVCATVREGEIESPLDSLPEDVFRDASSSLTLRDEPSSSGKLIADLPYGTLVNKTAESDEFGYSRVSVRLGAFVEEGYVASDFLQSITFVSADSIVPGLDDIDGSIRRHQKFMGDYAAVFDEEFMRVWFQVINHYEINTARRYSHFMAQMAHESAHFTRMEENLNYSTQGLMRIFRSKFRDEAEAAAYARQPEKIANRVYANRMGNGDEASGDGWRYRGRGFVQITGRAYFQLLGQRIGVDLEDNPDVLAENPIIALQVFANYWDSKNLNEVADRDDIYEVTRLINGGYNGIEDRIFLLQSAKMVWGDATNAN